MITDFPWYFTALCLLVGVVYAAVLYMVGYNPFKPILRWGLAMVRFLCVGSIAFLLLAPMTRRIAHERQQPHIVLLQDTSLSVKSSGDSTFSLSVLQGMLEEDFRVNYEQFGSNAATDISAAMARYAQEDVSSMVIASDGLYNRGSNPATLAESLPFPVYSIALGDTVRRRDASIGNLRCNRIALMGNSIPMEFTVNAFLLKGETASLSILDGQGKTLFQQRLLYEEDVVSVSVVADVMANIPGLQKYSVKLSVVEGELNTSNNVLSFYVDVVDTRQKVAIVADAPHPDIAALKYAVESNRNYEVHVLFADEILQHRGNLQDSNYSLVFLHNLPSKLHPDIHYAEGLPNIYIIGLGTDLARFNALQKGLEIIAKTSRANEVTAVHQSGFTLFTLNDDDVLAIEGRPPLVAPFGEARVTPDVQCLFTARIGPVDSRQPLVAATSKGGQRSVFVWGEGLWRWRLADYVENKSHEHFDHLVSQMVSFAAMQAGRDRLQIDAQRSYIMGEPIMLRAQVYNESYEPVHDAEVKIVLTSDSGNAEYTFVHEGGGYRLVFPDLQEGVYRYHATAEGNITADGSFAVEAEGIELHNLTADHGLLRTMSSVTGGELYYPDQLQNLVSKLSSIKPVIYSHVRYSELLRLPWVLLFLIVLLAVEWALRKYNGEL